jgi:predicted outer membrane repeat protein
MYRKSCVAEDVVGWQDPLNYITCADWSGSCTEDKLIQNCSGRPEAEDTNSTCEVGGETFTSGGVLKFYFSKSYMDDVRNNCKQSCKTCQRGSTTYICPAKGVHLGSSTTLHNSTATKGGGAVSATLCAIEMSNTVITDSTSDTGNGGALLLSSESTLHLDKNCTFQRNIATQGSGGAISCSKCDSMTFEQSTTFQNNAAGGTTTDAGGGAIHFTSPKNKITSSGSLFLSNTAEMSGGGLHANHGTWTSINDQFTQNVALSGSGGAVSATATLVHLDETTSCNKNRATKGGGGCMVWES